MNASRLGRELVGAMLSRNYPAGAGVFVYYVLLIGVANLIVDLLYPVHDPRARA